MPKSDRSIFLCVSINPDKNHRPQVQPASCLHPPCRSRELATVPVSQERKEVFLFPNRWTSARGLHLEPATTNPTSIRSRVPRPPPPPPRLSFHVRPRLPPPADRAIAALICRASRAISRSMPVGAT